MKVQSRVELKPEWGLELGPEWGLDLVRAIVG